MIVIVFHATTAFLVSFELTMAANGFRNGYITTSRVRCSFNIPTGNLYTLREVALLSEFGRQHFLGLDGLRGIAAFAVLFLHDTIIFDVSYSPQAAVLAVDFFFLLSGFVLAHSYDERLSSNRMTWRQFMAVRIIRLYPMLFVSVAVGGILFILHHKFDIVISTIITIGSFALLPVGLMAGTVAYPVNIPVWSLFFEFVASAVFGSRAGRLSNRCLVTLVVASGIALTPVAIWGGPYIWIGFGSPATFLLGFVRVSYPFWAGVLLFRIVRQRAVPRMPIGIIGFILALLLLPSACGPAYILLLDFLAFPVVVAFAACAAFGSLTARICSILGRLSYPLYIIHFPILGVIHYESERLHIAVSHWVPLVIGTVASVIVAQILLITFDEPVRKCLRKRAGSATTSQRDPANLVASMRSLSASTASVPRR